MSAVLFVRQTGRLLGTLTLPAHMEWMHSAMANYSLDLDAPAAHAPAGRRAELLSNGFVQRDSLKLQLHQSIRLSWFLDEACRAALGATENRLHTGSMVS